MRAGVTNALGFVPVAKQLGEAPELRIHSSQIICELLDDEDRPIRVADVVGRVVVTSLYNTTLPVIRYEIGDLASYSPHGLALSALRYIHGRNTADIEFRFGDHRFSLPEYVFWGVHVPGVHRYQVGQRGWSHVEVPVQLAPDVGDPRAVLDALRAKLGRVFRSCPWAEEIRVDVKSVPAIEADASGKVRITVPLARGEAHGP